MFRQKSVPAPTPPALRPVGPQIDHATIPAHTHLSCVPPVCNTSLFCGDIHTMWTHNLGLSKQFSRG